VAEEGADDDDDDDDDKEWVKLAGAQSDTCPNDDEEPLDESLMDSEVESDDDDDEVDADDDNDEEEEDSFEGLPMRCT
jgi:hypothetical protein